MPCHVSNCIPFRESFHITQPIYHVISNVYILQTMRKLMLNNPLYLISTLLANIIFIYTKNNPNMWLT